jgi:hypothetical protein
MKLVLTFAAVVILTVVSPGLLLAQSNTEIGTWKLNVAQSKYSPGPLPKSETRTYEAQGDSLRMSRDGVAGDGSKIAYTSTTSEDGKDVQISGVGIPNGADTISNTRVDANTVSYTMKRAGKVVQTGTVVVSKDGKFMTITSRGTNPQGQPTSNTSVWDKQ